MSLALALAAVLTASAPGLTVSVMPFDNRTGDADYDVMERGFADMLLTDLTGADGIVVVERARLNDVISELKLQRSALFDASTVQKLGKLLGATHLVTGQLLKVAPELRVDVRLVEIGSGKVLYGANVAGKPDRLFELEQELVTRFLEGLGKKGMLPTRSGPAKVETLLAYSRALADADSGDLKTASTKLAAVMKSDAGFRLAKERYAELLKRLREAGVKREAALSAGETELLAAIEAGTAQQPDPKKHRAAGVYLGYRSMRAVFSLAQLAKTLGPATVPKNKTVRIVRRSVRAAAKPMVKEYFDLALVMIDEAERLKDRCESTPEHRRANELGLGDYSDSCYTGWYGLLQLGEFVFTGETRKYDVLAKMFPAPAVLEPALIEPGLQLYVRAAQLVEQEKSNDRLRSLSEVAMAHGDALLRLGRKEEAMARWQQALDEMPTSPKYAEIEERMQKALGIHEKWKALDALKGCERTCEAAWGGVNAEFLPYDLEGLFARAEKLKTSCQKGPVPYPAMPAAGYVAIAYAAAVRGDCPTFTRAAAAAKAISADTSIGLDDFGAGCSEWDR